jgi:hypothetical protein
VRLIFWWFASMQLLLRFLPSGAREPGFFYVLALIFILVPGLTLSTLVRDRTRPLAFLVLHVATLATFLAWPAWQWLLGAILVASGLNVASKRLSSWLKSRGWKGRFGLGLLDSGRDAAEAVAFGAALVMISSFVVGALMARDVAAAETFEDQLDRFNGVLKGVLSGPTLLAGFILVTWAQMRRQVDLLPSVLRWRKRVARAGAAFAIAGSFGFVGGHTLNDARENQWASGRLELEALEGERARVCRRLVAVDLLTSDPPAAGTPAASYLRSLLVAAQYRRVPDRVIEAQVAAVVLPVIKLDSYFTPATISEAQERGADERRSSSEGHFSLRDLRDARVEAAAKLASTEQELTDQQKVAVELLKKGLGFLNNPSMEVILNQVVRAAESAIAKSLIFEASQMFVRTAETAAGLAAQITSRIARGEEAAHGFSSFVQSCSGTSCEELARIAVSHTPDPAPESATHESAATELARPLLQSEKIVHGLVPGGRDEFWIDVARRGEEGGIEGGNRVGIIETEGEAPPPNPDPDPDLRDPVREGVPKEIPKAR